MSRVRAKLAGDDKAGGPASLALPNIYGRNCILFTACGELLQPELVKLPKRELQGSFSRNKKRYYFHVIFSNGLHVHFDIAHESYFSSPPKTPSTIGEASRFLASFSHAKARVALSGLFRAPLGDAKNTPFYRTCVRAVETPAGDKFSWTGLKISSSKGEDRIRVTWAVTEHDLRYKLMLAPLGDVEIGGSYLVSTFNTLANQAEAILKESEQ